MALQKKLIVFKKYENYLKENQNGNILPYSWILVKDAKKLISNGVEIESVDWERVREMVEGVTETIEFETQLETKLEDYLKDYALKSELNNEYDDTQVKADIKSLQENKVDKSELEDYAKVADTSVIVNENDEIIPKLIIDFSENILNENGERIYTAKEVDANFATKKELEDKIAEINVGGGSADLTNYFTKEEIREITDSYDEQMMDIDERLNNLVWTGTQEEYDALTEKNNNTFYVIL